jgi:hypothetical protein
MDPRVRELVMLSALAALGCGLAAAQGDLWFVAIFGVPSAAPMAMRHAALPRFPRSVRIEQKPQKNRALKK